MSDNVWAPGAEEDIQLASPSLPQEGGELPKVGELLKQTIDDVMKNFGAFLLAGLGMFCVTLPLVFVGIFVMYGGMIFSAIFGIAIGEAIGVEILGILIILFGTFVSVGAMMLLMSIAAAPFQASIYRAVQRNLSGEGQLGFGSAFESPFSDVGRFIGATLLILVVTLVGLSLFILPALVAGLFLHFTLPAVIVHRMSPIEAARFSFNHVKDNLNWSLGAWGLGVLIMVVCQNIPIIGPMMAVPLYCAYQLRVYIATFGNGAEPA